jgi:adenylate cyclase
MSTQDFKRKLTAVFSADVAGYSRLMGEDEAATVKTLESYKQIMFSLIEQHRGRVIDSPGDNLLAEFASVVDAVQCGVAVQKELQARNADLPENRKMQFRIGINLGDVIEEQDRIYGDGVNIAARLEGLAEAGGLCVSGTAFDQVKSKLSVGYQYLGKQTVKNIPDPVRAYKVLMEPESAGKVIGEKEPKQRSWVWKAVASVAVLVLVAGALVWNFYGRPPKIEPASKEKMAFPLPDMPSIAVLPFVNMSEDPKQEFLCDGMTEDIITALSKVPRLFVIARNSTFTYKGKPVKVKQVSEELGVRYVLEGSLQRSGDRLRINAQLIDALTGNHLWAERYDRGVTDLFALQDEITMKILTAIQVKLTEGEHASSAEKYYSGKQGLDCYLKLMEARGIQFRWNIEANNLARRMIEEAIAMCPENPMGYIHLAWIYHYDYMLGNTESPRETVEKGIELAQKALATDDSIALAHMILCYLYLDKGDNDKAMTEAERAVALNPGDWAALNAYANSLRLTGRSEEAIPFYQKAIRLTPFGASVLYRDFGQALRDTRRFEEAVSAFKKAIKLSPDDISAHIWLAITYLVMGRENDVRSEGEEVLRIDPKFSWERWIKGLPIDKSRKDRLTEALLKAGLK